MLWHRQVEPAVAADRAAPRDILIARAFERAGPEVSRAATTLLLSQYCACDPALVTHAVVSALRLRLFGNLDALTWQDGMALALAQPAALELAERLDSRRLRRHLCHDKLLALLAAYLP